MTVAQAFEGVVTAIRTLAAVRGHELRDVITESSLSMSLRCDRCARWITVDLGAGPNAEPSITGQGLATCRRTPWGPPAAEPGPYGQEGGTSMNARWTRGSADA